MDARVPDFPTIALADCRAAGRGRIEAGGAAGRGGGTGRSRCARVFIAPYCIPIKSSGAGSRRTVKATDACSLLLLPPLPCRPAIVLLSVERCPPTTHDLGPGLATGIESGALFFLHGCISREGEDYYLHLDSPLLASGPKSKGERILSRYRPRCSRGDPRGDRFPSREGNRIGGYFPRARKGDFERFGWRREEREGRDAVVRRVSTRNGS